MALFVPWLVDAARTAVEGTGRSVIATPGWQTRGHGGMRAVEVVVGHHTATPESAPGDYPSAGVVTNGRAGLSGPLANYGLGRSGNIYVIAAGTAFHAGASAYAGFHDLNDEAIGIEAEDSGDGKWTPDQLLMYPRLVAACLQYMRRGVERYASHRTVAVPAGRKVDPAGISDEWMRQQASAVLLGGNDMLTPTQSAWLEDILRRVQSMHIYGFRSFDPTRTPPPGWQAGGDLSWLEQKISAALAPLTAKINALAGELSDDETKILAAINHAGTAGVDERALAEALAPALAPLLGPMISAGARPEQVEAACTAAIRKVFSDAGTNDPAKE